MFYVYIFHIIHYFQAAFGFILQDEEEEEIPPSLKVRIPKAGAYQEEGNKKEFKRIFKEELPLSKTESKQDDSKGKSNKSSSSKKSHATNSSSPKKKTEESKPSKSKGGKSNKPLNEKSETDTPVESDVKSESDYVSSSSPIKDVPIKDVPQCLKFKLSNGKMVR